MYFEDGQISYEEWCVDGKRHRLDGPARIGYYEDGQIEYEEWWIYGIKIEDISDWLIENNIVVPFSNEDLVAIKLRWS